MKKIITLLSTALLATSAFASSDWFKVTETEKFYDELRADTYEVTKTESGHPVVVMIGRRMFNASKEIHTSKWYIRLDDCKRKHGSLMNANMAGKLNYSVDFAFGDGTVAAGIAETICYAHDFVVQHHKSQSIAPARGNTL